MTKDLKICLSTLVNVAAPTELAIADDEEALLRLQGAFDPDDQGRMQMHAEAICYHFEQLVAWAATKSSAYLTQLKAHVRALPSRDQAIEPQVLVDCLITQAVKPT